MEDQAKINFVSMWRELSADGPVYANVACKHEHWKIVTKVRGLVEGIRLPDGSAEIVLARAGLDLVKTAEAFDFEALVKAREAAAGNAPGPTVSLVDCPECKGRGRVPVGFGGSSKMRNIKKLVEGPDGRKRDPARPGVLDGWDVGCLACGGSGRREMRFPAKIIESAILEAAANAISGFEYYIERLEHAASLLDGRTIMTVRKYGRLHGDQP